MSSPAETPMTVPQALEIKKELEAIDKLLEQLQEAMKTAQIGIIDMEELSKFAEPGDVRQLGELQQQIQEYLRQMAEQQGLEQAKRGGFQMTPRAYRLFQSKLLTRIFEQMQASRSGRHQGPISRRGSGGDCSRPSVRIRRLDHADGHPVVVHQRPAPRRPGDCRCG